MTKTLRYGKGYAGKMAHKCWIARITGTDATYTLQREFLEPTKVERERFDRPRTMINFSYELEIDGLYELSEGGERWFAFCYAEDSGEPKTAKVDGDRVRAWAKALDAGRTDREARLGSEG